jgi:hypothetical protein
LSDPATIEHTADRLLAAAYKSPPAEIFDQPDTVFADEDTKLSIAKDAADLLVRTRLAKFADDSRTQLTLTNAGRYWVLHGGYLAYLKDDSATPSGGGGGRQRNPEMEALRSEYMKLRLNTFWWSFGLSIAGFVMSLVSVAIALFYGARLLP